MTAAKLSNRLVNLTRLALMAGAAVGLSACVVAPDRGYYEPERVYYEPAPSYYESAPRYYESTTYYAPSAEYVDYVYYPAIGAYYDPRISLYFYYEHNHWTRTRSLPPHCRPYLDHHVTVRSPRDRPYADHDRHREHYVPERYRTPHDNRSIGYRRTDDVWVGAPRRPAQVHDRNDVHRDNDNNRDRNSARPVRDREPVHTVPLRAQETERARMRHEATSRNRVHESSEWHDRGRGPVTPPQSREDRSPASSPYKARVLPNHGQPDIPRVASGGAPSEDRKDQAPAKRKAKPARENPKKVPQNGPAQKANTPTQSADPDSLEAQ